MKPTVTIDLEEYQDLIKIRDAHSQNKSLSFYYYGQSVCVMNPDYEKRVFLDKIKSSQDLAKIYLKELNELREQYTTKKWYEFWK
jgi:hypothetical protein